MTAAEVTLRIILGSLALLALLNPAAAHAQAAAPLATNEPGVAMTSTGGGSSLSPMPVPDDKAQQGPEARASHWSGVGSASEPLTLQGDFRRTSASLAYAFSPAGFPQSSGLNNHGNEGWGNSVVGQVRAYATKDNGTSFLVNADFESFGQSSQPGAGPQAGGQEITMEWLGSRVFTLAGKHERSLDFDMGAYQDWLTSRPLIQGGPFRDPFPGYLLYSGGLEATMMLPEKNLTFTIRYGSEHLADARQRTRAIGLELSWTW